MSEVYKARHVITGKAVAVKILHQKRARDEMTVRRLKQEAKTAGALTHNNIVGVHDMEFDDGGTPFLVMDFIEGQSLAETLKNDGPLRCSGFSKSWSRWHRLSIMRRSKVLCTAISNQATS